MEAWREVRVCRGGRRAGMGGAAGGTRRVRALGRRNGWSLMRSHRAGKMGQCSRARGEAGEVSGVVLTPAERSWLEI